MEKYGLPPGERALAKTAPPRIRTVRFKLGDRLLAFLPGYSWTRDTGELVDVADLGDDGAGAVAAIAEHQRVCDLERSVARRVRPEIAARS
jgi:hypothetical protein